MEQLLSRLMDELNEKSQTCKALATYNEIIKTLGNSKQPKVKTIEQILNICSITLQCTEDIERFPQALILIRKVIEEQILHGRTNLYDQLLKAPAESTINILKNVASRHDVEALPLLAFDVLTILPQSALNTLVEVHGDKIIQIIDAYSERKWSSTVEAKFMTALLKSLSPKTKETFVKDNLNLWFSKIIPKLFELSCQDKAECVEALELLTDAVVPHDYYENPHFKVMLQNVYDETKYPQALKTLFMEQSEYWDKLWIVLIKLLKNQITKVADKSSPINALLPVVELGFKGHPSVRCRAFQCWDALIDNFSSDISDVMLNKRIKLLIVPLNSYNAKVVPVIHSKIKTWWHLIRKYISMMDRFTDIVLIPFLLYCFGKPHQSVKLTGGNKTLINNKIHTDELCFKIMVEIFGHVSCDGCVDKPKLPAKLISTKILVDHWNMWVHSIICAIDIVANKESETVMVQLDCLWKSFIVTIGELPENNIRKDLFSEAMGIVSVFLGSCKDNFILSDKVFKILICSLFDDNEKLKHLLKTKGKGPLHQIISLILNPSLLPYYEREGENILKKLDPFMRYLLNPDHNLVQPNYSLLTELIDHLLKLLPPNDTSLLFWIALTDAACKTKHNLPNETLEKMIMWPMESMHAFSDDCKVDRARRSWLVLYTMLVPNLRKAMDPLIYKALLEKNSKVTDASCFLLCSALAILQNSLDTDSKKAIAAKRFDLVKVILGKKEVIRNIEKFSLHFIKILRTMVSKWADYSHPCGHLALQMVAVVLKSYSPLKIHTKSCDFIEKLLNLVESHQYESKEMADQLSKILETFPRESPLYEKCTTILQKVAGNSNGDKKDNSKVIDMETKEQIKNVENEGVNKDKFAKPDQKTLSDKKTKKPDIVNKFMEGDEEFVVVKSNWKFNPKKLTDNQKDKFKRKREDIPALYQDLSQSQDEFKLTSWKTDSQDTSTTSSSISTSISANDNVSIMLKNIPGNEVVPNIMENILSDKSKSHGEKLNTELTPIRGTDNKLEDTLKNANDIIKAATSCNKNDSRIEKVTQVKSEALVKHPKSPRMALKDRVFRNVKNLIEKSNISNNSTVKHGELNKTVIESVPKTPSSHALMSTVHSAPPKIIPERPSRTIKKPKKFDDWEIFTKKGRRSQNDSQSSSELCPLVAETSTEKNKLDVDKEIGVNKEDNTEEVLIMNQKEETVKETTDELNKQIIDTQKNTAAKNETFVSEKTTSHDKNIPQTTSTTETNASHHDKNIPETTSTTETNASHHDKNIPETTSSTETNATDTNKQPTTTEESITNDNINKNIKEQITPKNANKILQEKKTSNKNKTSRIEKQLLIDMVVEYPLLQKSADKRTTRKSLSSTDACAKRRKVTVTEKFNRSKSDSQVSSSKSAKKIANKDQTARLVQPVSVVVKDSEEHIPTLSEDLPQSEDIIESSQDSAITTISVTATKHIKKKIPFVTLYDVQPKKKLHMNDTKLLLDEFNNDIIPLDDSIAATPFCEHTTEDIELSKNKTSTSDKPDTNLTENVDTQSIQDCGSSGDVFIINDEVTPIVINTEDNVGPDTQEIAEADTQPVNEALNTQSDEELIDLSSLDHKKVRDKGNVGNVSSISVENVPDHITCTDNIEVEDVETSGTCSPLKDDVQKKNDFLNDTLEISPIKTMSPIREKKSPSPETSSDFVVIKLTSPVQSNGEPFEKVESPEVFTEDKISPEKRDQSPPRVEVIVKNSSPSTSLSLKKNRPQVRPNGRAAQMLGLCAPDKLQEIMNSERSIDADDTKKSGSLTTPARRNLKMLYSSVGEDSNAPEESEDTVKFLNFKRSLPTSECNPSGPILKRKLIEIADDVTISPASKRKRVSFHDPPVSTTVSVQKYIEPGVVRSPQSLVLKRLERQLRGQNSTKSPKRLENSFKLDTVLTKTVESFTEEPMVVSSIEDTQLISMDQTPTVEVIKTSDLNDTDPICLELVQCNDPIENIASELSSPGMKDLFITELKGKVETISDLAKMTELEVNRLCIKAPKVKIAKKVLADYVTKKAQIPQIEQNDTIDKCMLDVPMTVPELKCIMELQTNDNSMQTDITPVSLAFTQTTPVPISYCSTQTIESGCKSTKDIIETCLSEKPDFIAQLGQQLQQSSLHKIAENLPMNNCLDLLLNKMKATDANHVLNKVLDKHSALTPCGLNSDANKLSTLKDYLCNNFSSKDLILFCSQVLHNIHEKPV